MSHNFNLRTHVKKIEAMYEKPRVKVKVERGLTWTHTRKLPFLCFIYARKMYVRTHVKITRQWKSTVRASR